jgi:membrane-associated phospholipid phosphatase
MKNGIRCSVLFFLFLFLLQGIKAQATFPYKFNKSDYYLISIGLATNSVAFAIENSLQPSYYLDGNLNASQVNFFDRGAIGYWNTDLDKLSDVLVLGFMAAPMLYTWPLLKQNAYNKALIFNAMYAEMLTLTLGIAELTKSLSSRYRPYMYGTMISKTEKMNLYKSGDAQHSFFSLHTAFAFGSAAFISKYSFDIFGKNLTTKVLCMGSFSIATGIGLSRFYSGQHFPTDILMGAMVGTTLGYIVPHLHQQHAKHVFLNVSPTAIRLTYRW